MPTSLCDVEAFAARLASVAALDEPRFVRDDWRRRNVELASDLLPRPPEAFLRHPAIRFQMFVDERYLDHELPYVLDRLPSARITTEDPVGNPPQVGLTGHRVMTSSNTIHHLHHLLRYEDAARHRLSELSTVVEWGGGYGNLAKLFLRLHGGRVTYVSIDTPVFAALQWLYLSAILGESQVALHSVPGTPVATGKVNIVPVGLVGELDIDADLLISTWALNESTPAAQDHVIAGQWFGADGLLLAMHQGDPLEARVLDAGATPVPVGDFMPAQRYLVRSASPQAQPRRS